MSSQGNRGNRGMALASYLKAIRSATSEKDLSKLKPSKSNKVSNNIQGMLFPAVRRRRDNSKNSCPKKRFT